MLQLSSLGMLDSIIAGTNQKYKWTTSIPLKKRLVIILFYIKDADNNFTNLDITKLTLHPRIKGRIEY